MKSVAIGDIAEIVMGQAPSGKECNKNNEGVPFVKAGEFSDRRPVVREWTTKPLRLARDSDVLVCVVGATAGKVNQGIDCAIGRSVAAMRPIGGAVDSDFLYHFMSGQVQRFRAVSQGVAQGVITRDMLASTTLVLPPIDEQRRIAAILNKSDELRRNRIASLEKLAGLSSAIFSSMFGDPAVTDGRYPVLQLAELTDPGRPVTYGILKPGPNTANGVPYVRVADMKGGGIETSAMRRTTAEIAREYKRSVLRPGDLLMSIRGHVGRFAFVPPELDGANITQDSARLAVKDSMSAVYLRAAMEMPGLQQWMVRHTKGVAVRGINLGDLRKMPIPCPPLAQQEEFAVAMNAVGEQRRAALRQLEFLGACFYSLQSRAFRGEL